MVGSTRCDLTPLEAGSLIWPDDRDRTEDSIETALGRWRKGAIGPPWRRIGRGKKGLIRYDRDALLAWIDLWGGQRPDHRTKARPAASVGAPAAKRRSPAARTHRARACLAETREAPVAL